MLSKFQKKIHFVFFKTKKKYYFCNLEIEYKTMFQKFQTKIQKNNK